MADQDRQLNQKRKQTDDWIDALELNQEEKRIDMQQEPKEHAPEAIMSTTKITDVNIDCLEHIFKYFKFNDLLNVADSNQHLKLAARRIYSRRYGKMFLGISFYENVGYIFGEPNFWWTSTRIGLVKVLRCFGGVMNKLYIHYGIESTNGTILNGFVSNYCHENLTQINFQNGFVGEFFPIQKPFTNVQTVKFIACKLSSNQCQLNTLFPNLKNLKFQSSMKTDNCNFIEVHFPHLKSLSIDKSVTGFNNTNVVEALRLNPNLKSLRLQNFDKTIFQDAGKYLQNLENLELIHLNEFNNIHNESPICLKNVKRLQIINSFTSREEVFSNPPLKFGKIEEFICTSRSKDFSQILLNFISQNPLKKVHIQSYIDVGDGLGLARALPLVTELILDFRLSIAKAIVILNECQMLKFRFFLSNRNEYDKLRTQLRPEWRATIECEDTILMYCVVKLER